jgi:hypothetical protein
MILYIFPLSIFVVDNGDSLHPVDNTSALVRGVDPGIHYVYLPEANTTLALYWVNKIWIPYLHKNKKCILFRDEMNDTKILSEYTIV